MNSADKQPSQPLDTIYGENAAGQVKTRKIKCLINEEFCSYCKEGGNLLNCDRCPSSFHFLCHEPPLELDQIPKGDFLCNKCEFDTKTNSTLSVNEAKKSGEILLREKRLNSSSPLLHHNDLLQVIKNEHDSSWDFLIRMSKAFNPNQMRLSNYYKVKYNSNVPGTNKFRLYQKSLSQINNYSKTRQASSGLADLASGSGEIEARKASDFALNGADQAALSGGRFKSNESKKNDLSKSTLKVCQICKRYNSFDPYKRLC
jgi:hypothetical protein